MGVEHESRVEPLISTAWEASSDSGFGAIAKYSTPHAGVQRDRMLSTTTVTPSSAE